MTMRPKKLPLLPGVKWTGYLTILGLRDADYLVEFDAVDPKAREERYVMDRTVLTPKQLFDWTGYREPE